MRQYFNYGEIKMRLRKERFPACSIPDDLFDLFTTFKHPYIVITVYFVLERHFEEIKNFPKKEIITFISSKAGLANFDVGLGLHILEKINYIKINND